MSKRISLAIALTDYQKDLLSRKFLLLRNKPIVIRTPFSEFYADRSKRTLHNILNNKKLTISCIAWNIEPEKNQLSALRFAKSLKSLGVDLHLYLVGETNNNQSYAEQCKDYINKENMTYVEFTGRIRSQTSFADRCDFVLIPSKREGLPRAFIESIMHGIIPILPSNEAWAQGIINKRNNMGINLDFSQPEIAAQNFLNIISNKNKVVGIIESIKEARKLYDPDKCLQPLINEINKLIY